MEALPPVPLEPLGGCAEWELEGRLAGALSMEDPAMMLAQVELARVVCVATWEEVRHVLARL